MSSTWHFVESYDGSEPRWTWRIVPMDGSIEYQSPHFRTYGIAVIDAIKNGFQPRRDIWIVTTQHAITHYRPGKAPLTVPITDWVPAPALPLQKSRAARSDHAGAKGRRSALAEKQA